MIYGIIAEGKSDLAVLTNILKGLLAVDSSDIQYLVPELEYDETDLSTMRIEQFSNWTIVKQHCEDGELIHDFFDNPLDEDKHLVIQIDSAERHLEGYDVKPKEIKTLEEFTILRDNIIGKIKEWIGEENDDIHYAIAMEEIEAWVWAIYTKEKKDTGFSKNIKVKLFRELNRQLTGKKRQVLSEKNTFRQFKELTNDLRKPKKLTLARKKNRSLDDFCNSFDLNKN